MFREMIRKSQELSREDAVRILNAKTSGVLALFGDEGYPYAVPLSFSFESGKIFFHSAKLGHKIDAVQKNEKASFCVIDKDIVVPDKFNTIYASVIAFGKVRIITDENDRKLALRSLIKKYSPEHLAQGENEISKYWDKVELIEFEIEHITGKASRESIS